MEKKIIDRKGLLLKQTPRLEAVDLGDDLIVYVKQMTGHDRDIFEQSLVKEIKNNKGVVDGYERATDDFRAKLAVATVCDAEGNLILKPGDAATLSNNMLADQLEKIVNVAQRLNAISEADKEGLIKNSDADPNGVSSSDSVEN